MGRWGYTVFQGDADLDIVSYFEDAVGASMNDASEKLQEAREKLDAGLGSELMQKCRANEQKGFDLASFLSLAGPKYETIILAAYMMHVGAKISPDDRAHLAQIFPHIESRLTAWPLNDEGFRDPGQVQFKAALEHYVDGIPRSFFDPSCYNCGKTSQDLAAAQLKRCTQCAANSKSSFYCNKECQREDWKKHKQICKPLRQGNGFMMMNV